MTPTAAEIDRRYGRPRSVPAFVCDRCGAVTFRPPPGGVSGEPDPTRLPALVWTCAAPILHGGAAVTDMAGMRHEERPTLSRCKGAVRLYAYLATAISEGVSP